MAIFVHDKNFYKKVLTIGGPISAQQIITVGVNMMDTVMLGQLDEVALSASAAATQVHNLEHFISMGIGMGASVLIARYWGMKEDVSLRKSISLMYRCVFVMSLIFTLAVLFFPARIMALLAPDADVIYQGVRYLRWALPCFFLHSMSITTTIVLRNIRKMHIPMLTSIGAFFINIFFNWVFIFGKLGAPAMGVAGAALGTLISRTFEFSVICGYFFLKDKALAYRPKAIFTPCGDLLPEYLRISMPVVISDVLLGLGTSATVAVGGHIGKTFMSANTITHVTQQITTVFTSGLGQSAVIITGNTLGEGDADKAQAQGVTFTAIGFLMGAVCGLIILLVSPLVVGSYHITPETYDTAMELMAATALNVVFMAPAAILTKGVLRGGGDTKFLMVADVFFLWVVSVPLGCLAGLVWHWRPFFILLSLKSEHFLKAAWCMLRLRSGKWIKAIKAAPAAS